MAIINSENLELATDKDLLDRLHLAPGWFAVSWSWVKDKENRKWSRGRWCKVKGPGGSTNRVIRFGGSDLPKTAIAIDWEGWLAVAGEQADKAHKAEKEGKGVADITVSVVRWPMTVFCPLRHPDPSTRLCYWLALISVALGVLSIVLAIVLSLVGT